MRLIRASFLLSGAFAFAICTTSTVNAQASEVHWAYEAPRRPPIAGIAPSVWARGAIDAFTHERMSQHALSPSPEADRRTLIRRVTLDLTGLPASGAEVEAFLTDRRPGAYERLVDRLLQSPRFGERMATHWLDLARYADTHGYHMDAHRDMWRWRDWVIDAYNSNMPFDQFTIEQLAGDLLPGATLSQKVATGFNRNNMVNFENGAIAEEFLTEYAVDRVATTATVWLGQTMICARCHDHKYDPFTQRDFYRLYAFFDQVPEHGVDGNKGNAIPLIAAPLPHQSAEMERLEARIASLEQRRQAHVAAADAAVSQWEATLPANDTRNISASPQLAVAFDRPALQLVDSVRGESIFVPGKSGDALLFDGTTYADLGNHAKFDVGDCFTIAVWLFPTTLDSAVVVQRTAATDTDARYRVELSSGKPGFCISSGADTNELCVSSEVALPRSQWQHLAVRYDGAAETADVTLLINGEPVPAVKTDASPRNSSALNSSFVVGSSESGHSFRGLMDDLRVYAKALTSEELAIIAGADPIGDILAVPSSRRSRQQTDRLTRYYLEQFDQDYRETLHEIEATKRSLDAVRASVPTTMVMQDAAERKPTRILTQGTYDSPGDVVEPGVPEILPQLRRGQPADRLALARWLVASDHPLASRVAVNHLWQLFFGAGLVRTPEDFGTRGEPPTHPELLDWLATEFAQDWDVKRLVRALVTSATYRQSHRSTPDLAARDAENRWLARAPRLRLSAEMIRDHALCCSGLLVERIGGPAVFPYQPAGLWEEIAYNANDFTAQAYRQSHGSDLYRRSLYTFVKRSVPSPTLAAFDAPNRETCLVQRPRTNTPQQALVLMNDVTFVEAARALAERALAAPATTPDRINRMFLCATGRLADDTEMEVLSALVRDLRAQYRSQESLARELIARGELPVNQQLDATELAAWTAAANVILSLDEAITRP